MVGLSHLELEFKLLRPDKSEKPDRPERPDSSVVGFGNPLAALKFMVKGSWLAGAEVTEVMLSKFVCKLRKFVCSGAAAVLFALFKVLDPIFNPRSKNCVL